ncbi:MAG: transcription termination/antitermination protein NusA, partial [Clostridia bacterium]|nr:transcription termination/antitermination protein NusA [Clostridia bacterium]
MKQEKSELIQACEELAHEKDISVEMLYTAIEEALRVAYRRNLPRDAVEPSNVVARMNRVTGAINVYARMMVVEEITNQASQIGLEAAQKIRPSAQIDDIIEVDVTPKGFLRVAALTAKQVIMQRIREAERGKIYDEYIEKTDEILTAVVQRVDETNVYVELGTTEGILEKAQCIPGEELYEGDHVKVYVLEVQRGESTGSKGPQVRVSRIHPNLVKRLFEMEVPEIAGGVVTIKSIAREPGSRTKIAVHSNDPMIDPVGSCVGQQGGRVKRVVTELHDEKIDIIKWSDNPAEFVANALNPAHVVGIYTADEGKMCRAVVPDNQLSLAIGDKGQNARLAAKLTGWK